MSNVLSTEKKQQVIALGRLGWPLRRIEQATGVRRETAGSYLRAAGIAVKVRRQDLPEDILVSENVQQFWVSSALGEFSENLFPVSTEGLRREGMGGLKHPLTKAAGCSESLPTHAVVSKRLDESDLYEVAEA